MGRNADIRQTVTSLIAEHGLASPHLARKARGELIRALASKSDISEATFYRYLRQRREEGHLARRTRSDAGRSRQLPSAVVRAIQQLHYGRGSSHLTTAEMHRQLIAAFPAQSHLITYNAVLRMRNRLFEEERIGDEPPMKFEVPHANYQWQIDDSISDMFVQGEDPTDPPRRVVLSAIMDEKTRCYMFAQYVRHADRGAFSALMFNAITKQSDQWPQCGVPKKLRADWGKVFVSDATDQALKALGIERSQSAPYHPQGKGKVERGFRTVHEGFERLQPGFCPADNTGDDRVDPNKTFRLTADLTTKTLSHKATPRASAESTFARPVAGAQTDVPFLVSSRLRGSGPSPSGIWVDPRMNNEPLLTLDEANARLQQWIIGEYHTRKHSSLGMSPNAAWQKELLARPELARKIPRDILYEHLLIPVPGGSRTVRRQCVQFDNLSYTHPILAGMEGVSVIVKYAYEDLDRVWVFDVSGRCLCEAKLLPTIIVGEDMNHRRWREITREARRRRQTHEAAVEEALSKPALVERLHDRIHRQAEEAPPLLVPDAVAVGARTPSSASPSAVDEDTDLADLSLGGIPLASGDH